MQKEMFKDIPGYENIYQVSNIGRVKRIGTIDSRGRTVKEKILKQNLNKGYYYVELCHNARRKKYAIHRLVSMTFITNVKNKNFVNHINCIKTDNRVENLEWCTRLENAQHAAKNNLYVKKYGEKNTQCKLSDSDVKEIRKLAENGMTRKDIAKLFNCTRQHVSKIVLKQRRV